LQHQTEVVGQALPVSASELQARDLAEPVAQLIPQAGHRSGQGRLLLVAQGQGRHQAGGQHHWFRTGPQPPLLAPAGRWRQQGQARLEQQGTNAPGPLEFMGRKGKQIWLRLGKAEGYLPNRLHGIAVQQHPCATAKLGNRFHRLHRAHL
jgi:hypothetical protein